MLHNLYLMDRCIVIHNNPSGSSFDFVIITSQTAVHSFLTDLSFFFLSQLGVTDMRSDMKIIEQYEFKYTTLQRKAKENDTVFLLCGSCLSLLKHLLLKISVFSTSCASSNQLLIEIIDASSVITWDFDVCKGDVVFNIYHSKRAPQPPRKDPLGAHGITSPGGNNVQLIDKSWTLGQDYSMVESPLTCKEGESVQVRIQDHQQHNVL